MHFPTLFEQCFEQLFIVSIVVSGVSITLVSCCLRYFDPYPRKQFHGRGRDMVFPSLFSQALWRIRYYCNYVVIRQMALSLEVEL